MNKQIYIIDTSALLSGKPLNFPQDAMMTTPLVAQELQPGGRDYRMFQLLQEKGLRIQKPSDDSLSEIKKQAEDTGDSIQLSAADLELLALALDIKKKGEGEPILLSDDYAIQNVAHQLKIGFQSISQKGITKKFKWVLRCPGCKRTFTQSLTKDCPICGTSLLKKRTQMQKIKKDVVTDHEKY